MTRPFAAIITSALAFAASSLSPACASVNLVSNPGFETGDLTGWTPAGNFDTGYNLVTTYADNNTVLYPYAGNYYLGLGNYTFQGYGGVSQTLSTEPGRSYEISLAWAVNGYNYPWDQSFLILWDNVVVGGESGIYISPTWTILTASVVGTGSDNLTLLGFSWEGWNGVDDVSVSLAVPELSTWIMMLSGLAGLGCAGFRRKSGPLAAFPLLPSREKAAR